MSCNTLDSIKKGLIGEKEISTDEFFIKKKDPLIIPPDFEDLPTPDELSTETAEISDFEKDLEISIEDDSSAAGSVEDSILKKIRSK